MAAPEALYVAVLDSIADQVVVLCRDQALLRYKHEEYQGATPVHLGVHQVGDRVGFEGGVQFAAACRLALSV